MNRLGVGTTGMVERARETVDPKTPARCWCGVSATRRKLCWKHYRQLLAWEKLSPIQQREYVMMAAQIYKGGRHSPGETFIGLETLITTGRGGA